MCYLNSNSNDSIGIDLGLIGSHLIYEKDYTAYSQYVDKHECDMHDDEVMKNAFNYDSGKESLEWDYCQ